MHLQGQHGYAMVVLLVAMSVAAILMSAAMPVWHQSVQREKEAELIFRGNQYVHAIGLFQRRSGPGVLPPNLDVLVSNHFLRKKFKDPITGQDFDLLSPVAQAAQAGGQPGGGAPAGRGTAAPATATSAAPAGRGAAPPATAASGAVVSSGAQAAAGGRGAAAGIIGVASKSKDASIRIYNGRTHYNEWQFLYVQTSNGPGTPGGGARGAGPGQGAPATGSPQPGAQGAAGRGAPQLPGRGRSVFGAGPAPAQGGRGPAPPVAPAPQPSPARGSQPTTPTSPFAPRR
jgi:type II secretory pathway pseudopilin PulG